MLKIGLIINPVAGLGGKVGLRGSDGEEVQEEAIRRGGTLESGNKTKVALKELLEVRDKIRIITAHGIMGENVVKELSFNYKLIGKKKNATIAADTENIARKLKEEKIDILVFSGGDGTARNIYNSIGLTLPCVGVPTGVKIHSAVYGNNPKSAGLVIKRYIENPCASRFIEREVMDIDEELFRQNIVEARLYGYLLVPYMQNLMQGSKVSSRHAQNDIQGITEEIIDLMELKNRDTCYIFGTGGTTYKVLESMGLKGTLLGIDIVQNKKIALLDASENQIYNFIKRKKEVVLIVTPVGGQGHIFGRGNQQLSPRIIEFIKKQNLWIIAYADKIYGLKGNALVVDTSDSNLDMRIAGYKKVIVGWQKRIVCRIKA